MGSTRHECGRCCDGSACRTRSSSPGSRTSQGQRPSAAAGSCAGSSAHASLDTAPRTLSPGAACLSLVSTALLVDAYDLDRTRQYRRGRDIPDRVWIGGDECHHLGIVRLLQRREVLPGEDRLLPVSLYRVYIAAQHLFAEQLPDAIGLRLIHGYNGITTLPGGDLLEKDVRQLRAQYAADGVGRVHDDAQRCLLRSNR